MNWLDVGVEIPITIKRLAVMEFFFAKFIHSDLSKNLYLTLFFLIIYWLQLAVNFRILQLYTLIHATNAHQNSDSINDY